MLNLPQMPVSAGAILLDSEGRLLLLKPTYKSGWTIPGGVMEDDGETPWEACRREVREETAIEVTTGRLVCVDCRPAKEGRKLGLRFLFYCGEVTPEQIEGIRLQAYEVTQYRWVAPTEAVDLLRPAIRRRVRKGLKAVRKNQGCLYLEDGRRVSGVS